MAVVFARQVAALVCPTGGTLQSAGTNKWLVMNGENSDYNLLVDTLSGIYLKSTSISAKLCEGAGHATHSTNDAECFVVMSLIAVSVSFDPIFPLYIVAAVRYFPFIGSIAHSIFLRSNTVKWCQSNVHFMKATRTGTCKLRYRQGGVTS